MRTGARLEVSNSLQDSTKRSLLRATMEGSKFTRPELEQLYFWFEVSCCILLRFDVLFAFCLCLCFD